MSKIAFVCAALLGLGVAGSIAPGAAQAESGFCGFRIVADFKTGTSRVVAKPCAVQTTQQVRDLSTPFGGRYQAFVPADRATGTQALPKNQ